MGMAVPVTVTVCMTVIVRMTVRMTVRRTVAMVVGRVISVRMFGGIARWGRMLANDVGIEMGMRH